MKSFTVWLLFLTGCLLISCRERNESYACFRYFEYRGMDSIFEHKIDKNTEYRNPVLSGFYPDPSICRKGDDFYLVHSSFSFYPGIPVFTSKDLVNWTQIGHALDRPSLLDLDGRKISEGIYAPAIEYNPHNQLFYLVTTNVYGIGNFLVKTRDPYTGWSEPILLPEVGGIDPSFFFDDDGKAYIVHNSAPEGEPEWEGHRAIWIHRYDTGTDRITGTPKVIIDGGADRSACPVWIEGPHLYKRNGKYLLIAAEGGTGTYHSQVAFISNDVMGPYVPYDKNPVLTQRDLPENRTGKITSTGHADLIEDNDGKTWAVFLGCRPYEGNHYNTGRETFLLPVEWDGDFPVILPQGEQVPLIAEKINLVPEENYLTGNFTWRDNFQSDKLDMRWLMIRTPRSQWYDLADNRLKLQALEHTVSDMSQPAFLGHRQQHTHFEVITEMEFQPVSGKNIAGLVCFQNEAFHIVFGKSYARGKPVLFVDRTEKETLRVATLEIAEDYQDTPIRMKIKGTGGYYSFYAAFGKNEWQAVAENIDGKNLSTENAGGFSGTMVGIYATSGN